MNHTRPALLTRAEWDNLPRHVGTPPRRWPGYRWRIRDSRDDGDEDTWQLGEFISGGKPFMLLIRCTRVVLTATHIFEEV